MGNFFTDDPTGAVIGLALGKIWKQNWDNRSYEKAHKIRQGEMNVNDSDNSAAKQRLMNESGYGSLAGMNPSDALINNKKKWAEYEQAANGLNQQLGAAQASGDKGLITSLMEQARQNQARMDSLHNQSEFIRQLGANKGWDLSGYGANDTLGAAQAKHDGTAALSNQIGNNSKLVPNSEGLLSGLGLVKRIDDTPKEKTGLLESLGLTKLEDNAALSRSAAGGNNTISADDLSEMLMRDPAMQAKAEAYAQASRDERVKSPGLISNLEAAMRRQGVDPGVMQSVLFDAAQNKQRSELEELIDRAYSTNDPRIANQAMLKAQLLGRPDLPSAYAQTNATPRDEWRFNTQKNAWEIQNGYRKDAAKDNYDYTQADKNANVGRQQTLDNSRAELQVDTAGKMAEIQREANNLAINDRIMLAGKYPQLSNMLFGVKPQKLPSYANDIDKAFSKAMQAADNGDVEESDKQLKELEVWYGQSQLDDEDREKVKLLISITKAKHGLITGNMTDFNKYISVIPEEERKKYGLFYGGNNATLRAPR